MGHIKKFDDFLNEGKLPSNIERELRLPGVSFEMDEEWTEEGDERFRDLLVYTGIDKKTGSDWAIKVGESPRGYILEIQKNGTIIFVEEYSRGERAHFDQDCMNSLGFLYE
jgi:hypothetical protein